MEKTIADSFQWKFPTQFFLQVPNFIVQVPNFIVQVPNFMFPNYWMALRMLIKSGGHPASPIKHLAAISKLEKDVEIILFMVALKVQVAIVIRRLFICGFIIRAVL